MIRNFFLNTFAVAIVFYILHTSVVGSTMMEKGINVFVISLLLSAVNLIIKPILKIVTLPINIITFGLFSILINALMIKIVDFCLSSFDINGFVNYVIFAVLLSVVNVGLSVFKSNDEDY